MGLITLLGGKIRDDRGVMMPRYFGVAWLRPRDHRINAADWNRISERVEFHSGGYTRVRLTTSAMFLYAFAICVSTVGAIYLCHLVGRQHTTPARLHWCTWVGLAIGLPFFGLASRIALSANRDIHIRSFIEVGYCPSCGYRMAGSRGEADGCVVCAECGGAWFVPETMREIESE